GPLPPTETSTVIRLPTSVPMGTSSVVVVLSIWLGTTSASMLVGSRPGSASAVVPPTNNAAASQWESIMSHAPGAQFGLLSWRGCYASPIRAASSDPT